MTEKGKAHKQVKHAGKAAVHVWIRTNSQHADPTVNGMIVSESLKCERSHVGMQKQISM